MNLLSKFESRVLTRSEKESISGGASAARCQRMFGRYVRRGGSGGGNERLWNRIQKNCQEDIYRSDAAGQLDTRIGD